MPGVVGDLVWNDTDQDGVKDTGESGISGVLVKRLNAADLTTVTTTVTDGNGTYSFTAVAPGDYRIEFVRPTGYGFSPADAGGNDALDGDADIGAGRTAASSPCCRATPSATWMRACTGVDYGDYSGFASATQTVNSAIRIGTLATDAEATNPSNSAATGDDNTGDDEDLTMPSFTVGSATTLAVPMTVTTASLNGSTACVNVFVDWNGDSDVADTNETLTAQTVSASGTFNFSLDASRRHLPWHQILAHTCCGRLHAFGLQRNLHIERGGGRLCGDHFVPHRCSDANHGGGGHYRCGLRTGDGVHG